MEGNQLGFYRDLHLDLDLGGQVLEENLGALQQVKDW